MQDYGRRLVIANVEESDFGGYFCQVRNSVGLNSLVLTLEEEPKSYEINFKGITPSYTITPNRYASFNLTCAVDIVSSDAVSLTSQLFPTRNEIYFKIQFHDSFSVKVLTVQS